MALYADMAKQIEVRFSLQGTIREDRQTTSFVSYCPTLDIYSAGRTRVDAKKALSEAVVTYVRLCYERGILGRILKEKGFYATPDVAAVPAKGQYITVEEHEHANEYDDVFDFDVPLHLIAQAQQQRQQECLQ